MKTLKLTAIIVIVFALCSCVVSNQDDVGMKKDQDIETFVSTSVQNELENLFLNNDEAKNLFKTAAVGSLELLGDYASCFFPYETRNNIENYYYNNREGEKETNDALKLDQKTKGSIKSLMEIYPDLGIVMINTDGEIGQTYPNIQFFVSRTIEIDQKVYVVQEMILFATKGHSFFEENGYKRIDEGWYSRNEVFGAGCGDRGPVRDR